MAPGFSWPVAYHLTWVPVYDVYVVTQSADSPDMFGYCDFAIGHFPKVKDPIRKASEVIRDDWNWATGYGQERWECLFGTGRIDAATAEALADAVWGDDAEEWA